MSIPDAPWIGLCKEDYYSKVNGRGEYVGTCECCGCAIYENDYYYDDTALLCSSCLDYEVEE